MAAWVTCAAVVILAAGEVALRVRADILEKTRSNWPTDPIGRLEMAYAPFTIQHLHPQYFFFFPLDPEERVAISNEVAHLDRDGFRGQGPAFSGSRQLAFLVGGSSAFGHYSSSDETTISGYLNRIQQEYFFVNAGVPSWSSTQELIRVAYQLAAYRPSLVIAYNGANDAGLLRRFGSTYPPGTPENFDLLADQVDDLNGRPKGPARSPAYWFERLFPEVSARINRLVLPAIFGPPTPEQEPPLSPEVLESGIDRYIDNQRRMRDLVLAGGGRFMWVYQPVRDLHANVDPASVNALSVHHRFHKAVLRRDLSGLEFHDFAALFDRFYARVPTLDGVPTQETTFVDDVHLYDPGNAIVARELWRVICAGTPKPKSGCS